MVTLPDDWVTALDRFTKAQTVAGISEHTRSRRNWHIKKFAQWFQKSLDIVNQFDLESYLDYRSVTPETHRKYVKSFRAFWRWLYDSGYAPTNVAAHLQLKLTDSQKASMWAKARVTNEVRTTGPAPLSVPTEWEEWLFAYRRYLLAGGSPRTTVDTRAAQVKRFARAMDGISPSDVSLDDILDWMVNQEWEQETRRGHRSGLKSFYRWAAQVGRVDEDPTAGLPSIKTLLTLPRPAQEAQYQHALADAQPRERLMLRLAAELGLRRSEVARVHANDISQTATGYVLLVHGKGRKERYLPLTKSLYLDLKSFGPSWIFPSSSRCGHLSPTWVGKIVSRALPDGVSMHQLRHRFATVAYESTQDLMAVQQALGHNSPTTTQRYVALSERSARNLMELVGEESSPTRKVTYF